MQAAVTITTGHLAEGQCAITNYGPVSVRVEEPDGTWRILVPGKSLEASIHATCSHLPKEEVV